MTFAAGAGLAGHASESKGWRGRRRPGCLAAMLFLEASAPAPPRAPIRLSFARAGRAEAGRQRPAAGLDGTSEARTARRRLHGV